MTKNFSQKTSKINLLTFVDVIKGLSAPTLHAQYFDEYLKLIKEKKVKELLGD